MFSLIDFFCDTTKVMQKKKLSWKKKRKEKKSYARVCVRTGQRERKAHSFFLSMRGNLGKSRRRKKSVIPFLHEATTPMKKVDLIHTSLLLIFDAPFFRTNEILLFFNGKAKRKRENPDERKKKMQPFSLSWAFAIDAAPQSQRDP